MNDALVPAAVAASGGLALGAGILAYEHRQLEASRRSRVRLGLRFPASLDPLAAKAALSQLSGLSDFTELTLETIASSDGISFVIGVPAAVKRSALSSLQSTIPGLRTLPAPPLKGISRLALRLHAPSPLLLRTDDAEAACRSLLGGLTGMRKDETVVVRWTLRATAPTPREPREIAVAAKRELDREWRRKLAQPGFMVSGFVLVQAAASARATQLAAHVSSSFAARRDRGGPLRVTSERAGRSLMSMPKTGRWSGYVTTAEALPIIGWPLGEAPYAGVERTLTRELPAPKSLSRTGRLLVLGRDSSGNERSVGLSVAGSLRHQVVVGGTGSGKTTLIGDNALSDFVRGHGLVLIDPKGPDMVDSLANRIPAELVDRVVVIDPAAPGPTPGLNILKSGDPDLAAEVLVGLFARLYGDSWGIRSAHYAFMAIRALVTMPDARLTDLGRLFSDPIYRRQAVGRLQDPLLRAAWAQYEQLSAAEALTHTQPLMTKAMSLLSRPAVRAVLAADEPKIDVGRLLAEKRLLMISLSPGQLGEATAGLLASALTYVTWSAIEARSSLAPEARHPIFLYLDELSSLSSLPISLESLAERARGLGAGLVVATQTLNRLPDSLRRSLLGNAGTLLTFRASAAEARIRAAELPGLSAKDLIGLGPYEVAARIAGGEGSAGTVITGRTQPPGPETHQAAAIRAYSAERYGSAPAPDPRDEATDVNSFRRVRRAQ
jgi:hypothetical protein